MTVPSGELETVDDEAMLRPTDSEPRTADPETAVKGRSPWEIAKGRLRRDKITMGVIAIAVFFVLVAILAPLLKAVGAIDPYSTHNDLILGVGSTPTGTLGGVSGAHWFGVEPGTGRDLFARVVLGLSVSLAVAFGATIISILLGVVLGIVSGYRKGRIDNAISRVMDLILAFPQTLMLVAMSIVLIRIIGRIVTPDNDVSNTARIIYLILFLGLFGWPYFARIIRGQVLSLREREFVEAARSLGAKPRRIYFTELLPNLWAPILVYTTLILPTNISAEAALSFLGVGIQAPLPSFGVLLNNAVNYATADPGFFFIPGLLLILTVLSFNLLGDGLRDALDPKADRS